LREWHMRWFYDHLPGGLRDLKTSGHVEVKDISDNICGYSISGPNARKVLEKLTSRDISNENFKFMSCQEMDVGLIRAKVGRLSVAGELGYEINCHALELSVLRELLIEAGSEYMIKEYGYYTLNTLRLEKSFGIWNAEFMQAYTPGETGMDRWISWKKNVDYVGKIPATKEREAGKDKLKQSLVTLEIENAEAEAAGYEPLWNGNKRVGMTTSGGYGHSIDKSLAMALVEPEFAEPGTSLKTHIVGVERNCKVISSSPWDPKGERIRM
jgi:dimethylglycine dehydrogenase